MDSKFVLCFTKKRVLMIVTCNSGGPNKVKCVVTIIIKEVLGGSFVFLS